MGIYESKGIRAGKKMKLGMMKDIPRKLFRWMKVKWGMMKDIPRKLFRWMKVKWGDLKRLFRRRKHADVVAVVQITDETDEGVQDDVTGRNITAVTPVVLSITITCPDELEWLQREYKACFISKKGTREELLNQLIELHEELGKELEQINTTADKAAIASSSISLASFVLGAVGFGLAFETFGTSLLISLCGLGLGLVSSAISVHFTRKQIEHKKEKLKQIKEKYALFNKENEQLVHILSAGEYLGLVTGTGTICKVPVQMGFALHGLIDDVTSVSSTIARAGKTLVKTMGIVGKVFFFGGLAISVLLAVYDIFVLAKNLCRLIKGKHCEQAQAHENMAQIYKQLRDSGENHKEMIMGQIA